MKRIGIFLESLSLDDTFAFAKLADERGFDSAWFPEITWSDAFSLATAAAMGTKRIKLATGVVGIFSRSPALMAMSIAGLDELSGGRAVLGLGTQAKTYVELWHSAKFDKPVARMREYVAALRKILQNPFSLTSYKGRIFDIQGFVLTVKPKAQRIPIYVAAIGPQMQRVAGQVADGVLGYFYSVKYVKEKLIPRLKEGAERSGRNLKRENFDIAVGFPTVYKDVSFLADCKLPRVFVQSTHDQYGPLAELTRLIATLPDPKSLISIPAEDHFFAVPKVVE